MKGLLLLLIHLLTVMARFAGPGGVRGLVAENLLIKQQLFVLIRTRERAEIHDYRWKPHCGALYRLPAAA